MVVVEFSTVAATEVEQSPPPTRSEISEYVHDMAGQLAEMAAQAGLVAGAAALKEAQRVIESEY